MFFRSYNFAKWSVETLIGQFYKFVCKRKLYKLLVKVNMRLTRTINSRFPGLFQCSIIAFWISSIYLTYSYTSNSLAHRPLQVPNQFNHRNRAAKSFYEYNYNEKVILTVCMLCNA